MPIQQDVTAHGGGQRKSLVRAVAGGANKQRVGIAALILLVITSGLVLATAGLPGGDEPPATSQQNSTDDDQNSTGTRSESPGASDIDVESFETNHQAPVTMHTAVLRTNETDAGLADDQRHRLTGLDKHAEEMASDLEGAGLNVTKNEGQLYSSSYEWVDSSNAYANISAVVVTIDESSGALTEAADVTARTLDGSSYRGSPPATYDGESGDTLKPDYMVVHYQLQNGTSVATMTATTAAVQEYARGNMSEDRYANSTIGNLARPSSVRHDTGNATVELPDKPPAEILTPEELITFEDKLQRGKRNYSEYDPPEYEVVPEYYESNLKTGVQINAYTDTDEELGATVTMSAFTIGNVLTLQRHALHDGEGVDFVDVVFYTHDGDRLGEMRLSAPQTVAHANRQLSAETYASKDYSPASFEANDSHPEAVAVEQRNATRLVREGQLRVWAAEYERLLLEKYGDELAVNSTTVDLEDEELHVHTYVPEWPDDTSSSSPMAMHTHTTDIFQLLIGQEGMTEFEPEGGLYVFQENDVRFDGHNHPDRSSGLIYANTSGARKATSEGANTHEAYQWAAKATWDMVYFYRGHEPKDPFEKTIEEWRDSESSFESGDERNPPDEE